MAKFKVKFKIQALELEIEGERDDIPNLTQALQSQFGGMLATPSAIVDSDREEKNVTPLPSGGGIPTIKQGKRRSSSRSFKPSGNGDLTPVVSIDFRHDPQKWGNPKQSWSTSMKAQWLLFVVEAQTDTKDMSSSVISATFNKHFRQAGTIIVSNINRDLGAAKVKPLSPIGEDTTQMPPAWFLTEAGRTTARKLVEEATGTGTN